MGGNKRSWVGIWLLVITTVVYLAEHVFRTTPYTKSQLIGYALFIGVGLVLFDPAHAMELAKMVKDKLPIGKSGGGQ